MLFLIAEIGINHNGDLNIAKKLIDSSSKAGFDAVKFQKRTPEISTPKNQLEETGNKAGWDSCNSRERSFGKAANSRERSFDAGSELPGEILR